MSREKFNPLNHEGLPDELKQQLRAGMCITDIELLRVFKEGGGVLSISEVLVGIYKTHGKIKTRLWVTSNLHRMSKKGLLGRTGRKGEYRLLNVENQISIDVNKRKNKNAGIS